MKSATAFTLTSTATTTCLSPRSQFRHSKCPHLLRRRPFTPPLPSSVSCSDYSRRCLLRGPYIQSSAVSDPKVPSSSSSSSSDSDEPPTTSNNTPSPSIPSSGVPPVPLDSPTGSSASNSNGTSSTIPTPPSFSSTSASTDSTLSSSNLSSSSSSSLSPTPSPSSIASTPTAPPVPQTNAEINSSIMSIALPALGTLALDPLVALADMACVGHLGATALGGVGIGNNVFNISFTCFNFLGLATTPAIARAYARDDRVEASRLIAQALWVALISGVSAMCLLSCFTVPILSFFGANALILPHAKQYLRARIIAAPFFLTAMVGNGTFRGFQDTKTPLFVGLFANMINLILYPTLIFVFGLGTRGAGMAMATGQICAGVTLLTLLIRTKKLQLQHMTSFPSIKSFIPLLRTGAVLSVRTLSIYSTISYATATAARMGNVQVAAFEIGRQIFALFARLLDAISVAAQALVALALGRNDLALARRVANRIIGIGFTMGCAFVALLMLVVNTAPSIFTQNPAVRAAVTQTFPYMAIIQPINGLVFVFDGVFTAARKFTTLSSAIFVAAITASSFLYMVRTANLPLHFVWIGLNVMMILRATMLGLIYLSKWSPVPGVAKTVEAVPETESTVTEMKKQE